MEKEVKKKGRRPSWMTPFGMEGQGDVWNDRLWNEYPYPAFKYDAEEDTSSK